MEEVREQRPGFWGVVKTLAIRMFIIYMISMAFRRSTTPAPTKDASGNVQAPIQPSINVFPKGFMMVRSN